MILIVLRSVMTQQIDDLRQQCKTSRDIEDQLRKENQDLKDQLIGIQSKLYHAEDTSRSVNDKVRERRPERPAHRNPIQTLSCRRY